VSNQNLKTIVLESDRAEKMSADWGELTWYASGKLQNTTELTMGRCVIKPGMSNPLHLHPNCSEVLTVLSGKVLHTIENGKEILLNEGDTITIPTGLPHRAKNTGTNDAVMVVVFPTAERQFKACE
jgi:quercetin dioxygenase-like cupin family protein